MNVDQAAVSFRRSPVLSGECLLIRSTCTRCGMSRLVSPQDGTLEQWEQGHKYDRCQAKAS